jgi:hypothetical protein
VAARAAAGAIEIHLAGRHLLRRRGLKPGNILGMKPGGEPRHFRLRQVGERRHRPLAGADDGGNAGRIQGTQVRIIYQRRRPISSSCILAMAGGTGAVEIAHCLGGFRLGCASWAETLKIASPAMPAIRPTRINFFTEGFPILPRLQDRLGWFGPLHPLIGHHGFLPEILLGRLAALAGKIRQTAPFDRLRHRRERPAGRSPRGTPNLRLQLSSPVKTEGISWR